MPPARSYILSAIFKHLKTTPDFDTAGIRKYRQLIESSALALKPDPGVQAGIGSIENIEVLWLRPDNCRKEQIIMYVHGGGFLAGSVISHRDIASRISRAARAETVIFNYRLAPEHPFPEGFEDVKTVYRYLKTNYPGCRIGLAADSAGAGLALAMISELLEYNQALPECAVFISPWIDLECKNPSLKKNHDKDPMLSKKALKRAAELYAGRYDTSGPLISPVHNNFKGICPVLIQTGENEILLDDSKILKKKLSEAGAQVKLDIWKDMFHVWHYFAKYLPEGEEAIAQIGSFMQEQLND